MKKEFVDKIVFDSLDKSAISVRDGVQNYYGVELGLEPKDKIFTIYRSPNTIADIKNSMRGLQVTDDHIDLQEHIPPERIKGIITDSILVRTPENEYDSTVCIKNKLKVNDDVIFLIDNGKRELSLGYIADLEEHETYDFEQVNIVPHHLAIVQKGRCGEVCKFNDKEGVKEMTEKQKKLLKKFLDEKGEICPAKVLELVQSKDFVDADGEVNLSRIMEIAQALPEAIKTMPLKELQKLAPMLEKALTVAKQGDTSEEETPAEEPSMSEEETVEDESPKGDMEEEKPKEEKKTGFSDKEFNDKVREEAEKLADQKVAVIEKARDFLDEGYDFSNKSIQEIQRECLATQSDQEFSDCELNVAFKVLKKSESYKDFADSVPKDKFAELEDKEI